MQQVWGQPNSNLTLKGFNSGNYTQLQLDLIAEKADE